MNLSSQSTPETQSLIVYRAYEEERKQGDVWTKDYGLLTIPENWEFLPPGDPFLTRTAKKLGPTWALLKKDWKRRITRTLGLYAPAENLRAAETLAAETKARREQGRKAGTRVRERQEERYRATFRRAVLQYLQFHTEHKALAEKIADAVVRHACPVGTGTVARTQKLELEEKVRLAVRAHLRHQYTDYENQLWDHVDPEEIGWRDQDSYHAAKAEANRAVEEFLAKHRAKDLLM